MPLAHLGAVASTSFGIVSTTEAGKAALSMSNRIAALAPVRILVADDYEPFRRWVSSKLKTDERFQVVGEAADGLEAVQRAEKLTPDVILLDISIPRLNGMLAASSICRHVPSAKILFLTQNGDVDLVKSAMSNGARGYVLKANAGSELLPAIETVMRGETFVSSAIQQIRQHRT